MLEAVLWAAEDVSCSCWVDLSTSVDQFISVTLLFLSLVDLSGDESGLLKSLLLSNQVLSDLVCLVLFVFIKLGAPVVSIFKSPYLTSPRYSGPLS